MIKAFFSILLRNLGLIYFGDKIRYYFHYLKKYPANKKIKSGIPDIALPPDYMIYESFQMDYKKYYYGGRESCKWLISILKKYNKMKNITILDWGCGPARITRHFPALINSSCKIYGTDYNDKSIKWCKENLKGIDFSNNDLTPPLSFKDNTFNIIIGLSIFTHLSEKMHNAWFNELIRVADQDAIILFSTQGKAFINILSPEESKTFNNGTLVIRGKTREGHRTYSAFHSPEYIKKLISHNKVLEFIEGSKSNGKPQQDIWIIQVVK